MIDSIRMMLDLFNKKKEISYSEKVCFSTKRLDYTYIRRILLLSRRGLSWMFFYQDRQATVCSDVLL